MCDHLFPYKLGKSNLYLVDHLTDMNSFKLLYIELVIRGTYLLYDFITFIKFKNNCN